MAWRTMNWGKSTRSGRAAVFKGHRSEMTSGKRKQTQWMAPNGSWMRKLPRTG